MKKVNPKFTSQKCSKCGYIDKENRKTQSEFKCLKCGHSENADLNASKNILAVGSTV
ncbi:transposase [Thiovulum sp. ES]|nr:transposase [Thiovulum sp. ES]